MADYRSHTVQIAILGYDTDENQAIRARIAASLRALDAFIGMEDEHDGEFEDRPEVYVWMMFAVLRTRGMTPTTRKNRDVSTEKSSCVAD